LLTSANVITYKQNTGNPAGATGEKMHGPIHRFDQDERGVQLEMTKHQQRVRPLQHFEHAVLMSVSNLGHLAFPAEIARRLSKLLDRHVSLAQVFVSLERMEDRGLISSQESEPEHVRGGRRRRIFRLEASGVHMLSQTAAAYRRMSSELDSSMESPNATDETFVPSAT
jgi:DNA-binding MarR family transcriptional regulator